jgi:hypothetical protein
MDARRPVEKRKQLLDGLVSCAGAPIFQTWAIEETFACLRTRMIDGTGCEDPLLGFLLVASSLGCLLLRFLI